MSKNTRRFFGSAAIVVLFFILLIFFAVQSRDAVTVISFHADLFANKKTVIIDPGHEGKNLRIHIK